MSHFDSLLTFASDEISVEYDVVRLFAREYGAHQTCAVHVLLGAPVVPGVLPEVEVGEHGDLERPVWTEGQARLCGVWIKLV